MLTQKQQYPLRIVIPAPAGRKSKQPEEPWDHLVSTILREFPRNGPVARFVRQPKSLEISLYHFTPEQETWLNEHVGRWEGHTDEKPELLTDEQRRALQRLEDAESEPSILRERYDRMVEEGRMLDRLTQEHFGIRIWSGESLSISDGWYTQVREALWSWEHISGEQGHGFRYPDEARLAGIKWSILHERDVAK